MAHRQPGARWPEVTRNRSELCESPKVEAFCTELACMATFLLQLSLGDANLLHRPGLPWESVRASPCAGRYPYAALAAGAVYVGLWCTQAWPSQLLRSRPPSLLSFVQASSERCQLLLQDVRGSKSVGAADDGYYRHQDTIRTTANVILSSAILPLLSGSLPSRPGRPCESLTGRDGPSLDGPERFGALPEPRDGRRVSGLRSRNRQPGSPENVMSHRGELTEI